MTDASRPASSRRRLLVPLVTFLVIAALIALLYPQLMDFGAEIYRFVTGT